LANEEEPREAVCQLNKNKLPVIQAQGNPNLKAAFLKDKLESKPFSTPVDDHHRAITIWLYQKLYEL